MMMFHFVFLRFAINSIEIAYIGNVSRQNEIVHRRKYFPHGDSYK